MKTAADPLAAAKALRPLLESEADTTDRELTPTKPVVEALSDALLFHLMVPKEFGGLEADTDTVLDVFEELSHQDGSIGWTHMANASATAYSALLEPSLAREMVADKPSSVFAGQFAPRTWPSGLPFGTRPPEVSKAMDALLRSAIGSAGVATSGATIRSSVCHCAPARRAKSGGNTPGVVHCPLHAAQPKRGQRMAQEPLS